MGGIVVHRGGGDIADDAVTLAKMAAGTDGNIISYDASGDPVAVVTGDDGQVLTSAGAGQPPAFEDAGGGGSAGLTLIQAQTASDSATIDFTSNIGATYDVYMLTISSLVPATDDETLVLRQSTDGGSTWGATNYQPATMGINTSGTNRDSAVADSKLWISSGGEVIGNAAAESFSGIIWFYEPSNANKRTRYNWQGIYDGSNTIGVTVFGGGARHTTEDVDGVQLFMTSGNITSGEFRLYGLTN